MTSDRKELRRENRLERLESMEGTGEGESSSTTRYFEEEKRGNRLMQDRKRDRVRHRVLQCPKDVKPNVRCVLCLQVL